MIEALTVCVNFADFLAEAIPFNKKHFSDWIVVTDEADKETIDVCSRNAVRLVTSDRYKINGSKFNRGAMTNVGLSNLKLDDWILLIDADTVLPHNFFDVVDLDKLDKNTIYGSDRYFCEDYEQWERFKASWDYNGLKRTNALAIGFFQLFHVTALGKENVGYSEKSSTAAASDDWFRHRFKHAVNLPIGSIHLGHAFTHWHGRIGLPFVPKTTPKTLGVSGEYYGVHDHWQSNFTLMVDGTFKRLGNTEDKWVFSDNCLTIYWDRWEASKLTPTQYGFSGSICLTKKGNEPTVGPWTEEKHRKQSVFDDGLSECLNLMFHDCNSVLDVGCGLGTYIKPFANDGKDVLGIEPLIGHAIDGVNIMACDPTANGFVLEKSYDLVICQEVVEHVVRERHGHLFDFITNHANKYIVFSGAIPGQGGDGHVAERPEHEWMNEFSIRKWVPDYERTAKIRSHAKLWWFKNNLVVFRRGLLKKP